MSRLVKLLITSEPLGIKADVTAGGIKLDARYSFYLENKGLFLNAGKRHIEDETTVIANWTKDTQRNLKIRMEEMTNSDPPTFEDYVLDLGSIGAVYYNKLIPEKVQQYIRKLPSEPVHYLYIYAENHWIPYELIYDTEGHFFWGEKCIIVRVPMLEFSDKQSARSVIAPNPIPISSVVNIVGDQVVGNISSPRTSLLALDTLTGRCPNFDSNYHNGNWVARSVCDVRSLGADASILHFTCHGRWDAQEGYYLQLHATANHPQRYRLNMLNVQSHLNLEDTLVFVNACTSDVPGLQYGTFMNLGQKFFENGAGVFIGTIAPVPIEPAVILANTFYEYLLKGESIGIALHKTKMDMKTKENPFYLFYCLYGNAYKRFTWV